MDKLIISQPKLRQYCEIVKRKEIQITDIINSEAGSLRLLKDKYSETVVLEMVVDFITYLLSFYNVARPMSANQVAITAKIIFEKYSFWTPEDFKRCFDNIHKRKYEHNFFEGIDGDKIMKLMDIYEHDFVQEQKELYKKQVEEKRTSVVDWDTSVLKGIKASVEKIGVEKKQTSKPIRQETDGEKLMQGWFKEFDALHKEQDGVFDSMNLRMVNYKGITGDINKFINLKLEEHKR